MDPPKLTDTNSEAALSEAEDKLPPNDFIRHRLGQASEGKS